MLILGLFSCCVKKGLCIIVGGQSRGNIGIENICKKQNIFMHFD